jgi:hypothetical protein
MKKHESKKQQWANQKAQVTMRTEGKEDTELTTTPTLTATPSSTGRKCGGPSSVTSNKLPSSSEKKKMM